MSSDYIFAGYCMAHNLHTVTPEQAKKLTHLNLAFGIVQDGVINIDEVRDDFDKHVEKIRGYNPSLHMLLSTGGGLESQRLLHGEATRTPEGLKKIVSSTMDIVRAYKLDGIDCDWEFPGAGGDKNEKYQHTTLMKAYRKELDDYAAERGRKCYLTIAAGCFNDYIDNIELSKMGEVLDFINLMCYDFRWLSKKTGHQCNTFTPLGDDSDVSVEWGVKAFEEKGFPREKLVVGAAFYSHQYAGVIGDGDGYNQLYKGEYTYGPNYTEIVSEYEKNPKYKKYWDDTAKEPWLFDGENFITYSDPTSIKIKCEYVKEAGLGGMMYWEHGADLTGALFDTIYDNLK